jgi:hypothetical protein
MRGNLSRAQKEHNKKLGRARVIAENFYGRLKTLWGIMREKYQGDRARYPTIFLNCVALTNFHISKNPLRKVKANGTGIISAHCARKQRRKGRRDKSKTGLQNENEFKKFVVKLVDSLHPLSTSSPSTSASPPPDFQE